jgi:glycosyltransferase involved in cell wall biosynthesis
VIKFAGQQASLKAGRAVERLSLEILRWFYGRAEIIMAPNCELVEFTHALTNKPCHIMGRGVDTEIFHPSRRKRVNNAFQIGYVGRLTTEKNVRLLAALNAALRARCLNSIEFVIVGEGSELEWLRNHIPHARFTGVLRGQALAEAFANMDVFVFPSHTDTFGNVVLEALASGVPTVVTNHGGPKFLVQPGITGFVAESEGEFVDAVSVLMGSPHLHARMRSAAVDYAKEHSWDRVFESVWDVYSEAIALNPDKAWAGHPSPPLLSSRVHGRSSS